MAGRPRAASSVSPAAGTGVPRNRPRGSARATSGRNQSRVRPPWLRNAREAIVVLADNVTYWPRSEAICGATTAARRLGYTLICLDCSGPSHCEEEHLAAVLRAAPAGVLFVSPYETKHLRVRRTLAAQLPTAQILLIHPRIPCDQVIVDDYAGATLVVEHLVALGHERIGYLTFLADTPPAHDRLRGYGDALERAGLPVSEQWILRGPGHALLDHRNTHRWRSMLRDFLGKPDRPSAVFAYSDLLAIELVGVAWEMGLAVPRDLAVAGFDDLPVHSLTGLPLTTVHQDFRRLGALAVRRLVSRIRGEVMGPPAQIRVAPRLIVRESTTGTAMPEDPWERVRAYLEENFRHAIVAEDVAQAAPFEVHYFFQRFPKVFGKRFAAYLRDLRLERARDLLLTTGLTIDYIASQCGFRDPKHFYRVFKRMHNMTPREFRLERSPFTNP